MIVLKFTEISSYFKSLSEIFLTMTSKIFKQTSVTLVALTFFLMLEQEFN